MYQLVLIPTFTCNISKNRIKLNTVAICKYASIRQRGEKIEKIYIILTRKYWERDREKIWNINKKSVCTTNLVNYHL